MSCTLISGTYKLGFGQYRIAYLDEDSGTVHKIARNATGIEQNLMECDNVRDLNNSRQRLPQWLDIPEWCHVTECECEYGSHTVMPYIDGNLLFTVWDDYQLALIEERESAIRRLGLIDFHGRNVVVDDDGKWWLIDLSM